MRLFLCILSLLVIPAISGAEEIRADADNSVNNSINIQDQNISKRSSGNIHMSFSAGIDRMSGDTTYQIGGNVDTPEGSGRVRFPLSELKFPLNVFMMTFEIRADLFKKVKFECSYSRNITKDAGKMEDSDWGIFYSEYDWWEDKDSLDVFSETDAELKADIADADISYMLMKKNWRNFDFNFYIGAGFLYQTFSFDVSNLDQWYPSLNDYAGYEVEHDRESGLVGTYQVTSKIPYGIIALEMNYLDKLLVDISFGYSPFVKLNDEDQHLLRKPVKISKAECDGDAILLSVAAQYFIYSPLFIGAHFDYISVDTEGEEVQKDGGEYTATIDQKNFSKRMNYGMAFGGKMQF